MTVTRVEVRRFVDGDWGTLCPILAQSFNVPASAWPLFRERVTDERFRVATVDGRIVGGCGVYALGQIWRGRAVPLGGVAGVGVAPEARGAGAARALMIDVLRWLREGGTPVAGLYPASWHVYRSVGYEHAGERVQYQAPLASLSRFHQELDVVAIDPLDPSARAAMGARYRPTHGNLARTDAMWGRLTQSWSGTRYAWLIGDAGYVVLQHAGEPLRWDLDVVDLAAPDVAHARTLLALLGGHRSLAQRVRWWGSPADALVGALPEPVATISEYQRWMLRIVDVPGALVARGWPPGARGELHLRVDDTILPENAGDWIVDVADGQAEVRRGGTGAIRVSERGFGPLYSGYQSPRALAAAGLLEGPDLDRAEELFAAPLPWMREMY